MSWNALVHATRSLAWHYGIEALCWRLFCSKIPGKCSFNHKWLLIWFAQNGSLCYTSNMTFHEGSLKNKFGPWKVLEKRFQYLYEPCKTQFRKLQCRNRKLRIPGVYQLKVDWGKLTALTILWSWRYPLSEQSGEFCVCVCSYGWARVDEEIWPIFMWRFIFAKYIRPILWMAQQIFVSSSKFSAPVMTLDSRDTQK